MTNIGEKNQLAKIVNEMQLLRKHKIFEVLSSIDLAHYVFARNYAELLNLINFYEEDYSVWDYEQRDRLTSIQKEFLRLLNNYLSSMSAMFDHMRHVESVLKNKQFSEYYANKKKQLSSGESGRRNVFLKGLRNFSQHYKLIPFSAELRYKDKVSKQSLLLKKTSLLEWKEWTKENKEYIQHLSDECESDDSIDVKILINKYHQCMNVFYASLENHIRKLYKKELDRAKFLDVEFKKLGSPIDIH